MCLSRQHSHCSHSKEQFRCVFLRNTPIVPADRTASGVSFYIILPLFPHKGPVQVCLCTKYSHCSHTKDQFSCVFLLNTPIVPAGRTASGVSFYIIFILFPPKDQFRCVFLQNTPIVPTQRSNSGVSIYKILPLFKHKGPIRVNLST